MLGEYLQYSRVFSHSTYELHWSLKGCRVLVLGGRATDAIVCIVGAYKQPNPSPSEGGEKFQLDHLSSDFQH